MAVYFSEGSTTAVLSDDDLREGLQQTLGHLTDRKKVIALPPDFTRFDSQAGKLTCMAYQSLQDRLVDVMPALGTHFEMPEWQLDKMFPTVPKSLFRVHRWRTDVETVGIVPRDYVAEVTEGFWEKDWPAQLNRLVSNGGHDLILSIGQVVPHEVIGMANHNKNLFVGVGGARGIHESHFLSAAYGLERVLGQTDTPLRRILNYAKNSFCQQLPVIYVLTVVVQSQGQLVVRGLFIGDDEECFEQAAALAKQVNFTTLTEQPKKIVVHLDEEEFHSTWIGNKSIYRTRMAIADNGHLVVLAPGVRTFGEDESIDALIRKYGYRPSVEVMKLVKENDDIQQNLSAAAHLIHGTSEGRFTITYCPGKLTKAEVERVGYQYGDLAEMQSRYDPQRLTDGWNTMADGERIYYVSKPALGLWAHESRLN